MRIFCETSSLRHNISRHSDAKSKAELAALSQLAERYLLVRGRAVLRELMQTADVLQRNNLIVDYEALQPIPKDEKLLGIQYVQTGQYGFVNIPRLADTQDDALRDELIREGFERLDAEHITQAVCNDCDVFLTRDERTIVKRRPWLEARFPKLKIRRPSELLAEIEALPGS
jgi:hypothetical protein